jgi:LmbE family N-acetylglucosaminyl deacetylase
MAPTENMLAMSNTRSVVRAAAIAALVALAPTARASDPLPYDRGAVGTWQALARLGTTASVLHVTAHPDDEDGGLLAWLSRGRGARVGLLTLNRGEGGDNALGPEMFDALGLIRTEELRLADRFYGVDRQYFTTVVDYGFSKRLDEALAKWGHEDLLREVVRVIRSDRPFVVVSRFAGEPRDGHGNHQAAGRITREAFEAAGDPRRFPELADEGLRPWKPSKLYVGAGFRGAGDATVTIDVGTYSPWLGDSFANVARAGLAFQRSQNSGMLRRIPGPWLARYDRPGFSSHEADLFDGIDTTIPGLFRALGRPAPEGLPGRLDEIAHAVQAAVATFRPEDPSRCVPLLARGLKAACDAAARCVAAEPDAAFILGQKVRQFQDVINVALGIEFAAVAQPAGQAEPRGPFAAFAAPPLMRPVIAGQAFEVRTSLTNRGGLAIAPGPVTLRGRGDWAVSGASASTATTLGPNQTDTRTFSVRVPRDAPLSRPYFFRDSIALNRYAVLDRRDVGRPSAPPALEAEARYEVEGSAVEVTEAVRRRESAAPYGSILRELDVVPALAVSATPRHAIVPLGDSDPSLTVEVELLNNRDEPSAGTLRLGLPEGWVSEPASHAVDLPRAGGRRTFRFRIRPRGLTGGTARIEVLATVGPDVFREGYEVLRYRDLEPRYLYRPAVVEVRGVDVKTVKGLAVGYVAGIGDEVPRALEQLGMAVQPLSASDLAAGDLSRFDAVLLGTRAYAVREDLRTHNARLLDYVRAGGNLVVLYNTPEFDPARFAPYPARLPGNAEEVCEEDAPVQILAPDDPVFTAPNRITAADFDGWVEQRGSKFLASWNAAYRPLLESHDTGQAPQRGGWVTARCGKGHYTYCAYALHRQLHEGVPGAYRLVANLLALGGAGRKAP